MRLRLSWEPSGKNTRCLQRAVKSCWLVDGSCYFCLIDRSEADTDRLAHRVPRSALDSPFFRPASAARQPQWSSEGVSETLYFLFSKRIFFGTWSVPTLSPDRPVAFARHWGVVALASPSPDALTLTINLDIYGVRGASCRASDCRPRLCCTPTPRASSSATSKCMSGADPVLSSGSDQSAVHLSEEKWDGYPPPRVPPRHQHQERDAQLPDGNDEQHFYDNSIRGVIPERVKPNPIQKTSPPPTPRPVVAVAAARPLQPPLP